MPPSQPMNNFEHARGVGVKGSGQCAKSFALGKPLSHFNDLVASELVFRVKFSIPTDCCSCFSRKMSPAFFEKNGTDSTLRNSEHRCQLRPSDFAWLVKLAYLLNLRIREFGISVFISLSISELALVRGVNRVLLMRAKKQVSGVYARRIIAGMTHFKTAGNLAVVKNPRNHTGRSDALSKPECAIAPAAPSANPRPTVVRSALVHLAPEALLDCAPACGGGGKGVLAFLRGEVKLGLHKSVGLICATLPARQGAGAFSVLKIAPPTPMSTPV